ncbi:acyltransferase family protein [Clostridium fungisolvens]|uniref:Acyltransferase 3 domain-containing protein n=1 Tax=Clostridium fungisolvens TaxID=1604897 RepID=A0A6V8SCC8_9CLOT|nr:acyltransferase family protein [Clostridium fungisolvens]GFP74222.1 hypothetical protein bsdtw1_00267 [Clostridium fungisolvens]
MNEKIKCESLNLENYNKRINYIDILRGIGILFMVMGHIGYGGDFDKYIHAFHMPLFILVSGYFFRVEEVNTLDFIKRKMKMLLVPYLSFGMIHYLFWFIFFGRANNIDSLIELRSFLWFNTDGNMPIAGALWFLTCLFIIEILFYFFVKVGKKEKNVAILVIGVSIVGSIYSTIINIRLPYAIDTAMAGIGIFYVGYLLKKFSSKNKLLAKSINLSLIEVVLLLVCSTILIFVNYSVNMRTITYGIIPLFWVNAILSTITYWNISRYLDICKVKFIKKINHQLIYIGKNSIVYLCLNQIVILISTKCLEFTIDYNSSLERLLMKVGILLITLVGLHVASIIINKTKLRALIGK